MKLKFKAKGVPQPDYVISGTTINGLDLSQFPVGGKFIGDETTHTAGIYDVTRDEADIYVTLAQRGLAYECCPINGSHDWVESDWIDSAEFDPDACYIAATSKSKSAVYVKRTDGFTVTEEVSDELV